MQLSDTLSTVWAKEILGRKGLVVCLRLIPTILLEACSESDGLYSPFDKLSRDRDRKGREFVD